MPFSDQFCLMRTGSEDDLTRRQRDLEESALQLLLPLGGLLQDGLPPLVQVLQFALQVGGLLASAGRHQVAPGLVDRLHRGLVSQNVILEDLERGGQARFSVQTAARRWRPPDGSAAGLT